MLLRSPLLLKLLFIALAAGLIPAATAVAQGGPWQFQTRLTASDGEANDSFGISMASDGDTALVGTTDPQAIISRAKVYVFVRDGETWSEQAILLPAEHPLVCPETGGTRQCPHYGWSVAISGNVAVAGQPWDANGSAVFGIPNPNVPPGAAYVFVLQGDQWVEQAKLMASDGEANDAFGYSVAVSGDTIVVGAPIRTAERPGIDPDEEHGAAYVFVRDGDDWVEQARLDPDDFPLMCASTPNDFPIGGCPGYGWSVAIEGDTVLVGAQAAEVNDNNRQGKVYVFTRDGGTWSQQGMLTAADGGSNHRLGKSVALLGNTALAGATGAGDEVFVLDNPGAAYIFARSGETWTQQQRLLPSDGGGFDKFGDNVALTGATIFISSHRHDDIDGDNRGAAYLYARNGGTWFEQQKLEPPVEIDCHGGGCTFGSSIALSGSAALVGAWNVRGVDGDFREGAAFAFAGPEALVFAPDSLDFGEVEVGDTSDPQSATLSNDGNTIVTGLSFNTPGGGFDADTSDCGGTLLIGQSCEVSVTFTPSPGQANTTLEASGDGGFAANLALTGKGSTGEPGLLDVEPAVLDFGDVPNGTTATDAITVSNAAAAGADALILSALDLSGDAEFEITGGTCNAGTTLEPGNTCTVQVTFEPSAEGAFSAEAGVATDDGQNATVDLLGSGGEPPPPPALAFEPAELDFGEIGVDETAGPQTATLHNTGDEDLTGLGFTAPDGDFDADTSACGDSLATGGSCPVSVTFTPSEPGPASAALPVESNEGASASLALSGMGGDGSGEPDEVFRDRFEEKP